MIAGLAGINAGPSAVARMAAVAQDGSAAAEARSSGSQVAIAARAMLHRAMRVTHWSAAPAIDARRVAQAIQPLTLRAQSRATPERRLE